MNLRRGLFRIWLVLTFCWVIGVAAVSLSSIIDVWRSADVAAIEAAERSDRFRESIGEAETGELSREDEELVLRVLEMRTGARITRRNELIWFWIAVAGVPPAAALALGLALLWSAAGFRSRS